MARVEKFSRPQLIPLLPDWSPIVVPVVPSTGAVMTRLVITRTHVALQVLGLLFAEIVEDLLVQFFAARVLVRGTTVMMIVHGSGRQGIVEQGAVVKEARIESRQSQIVVVSSLGCRWHLGRKLVAFFTIIGHLSVVAGLSFFHEIFFPSQRIARLCAVSNWRHGIGP